MSSTESPWSQEILDHVRPGFVTFAWDDGEIRNVEASEKTLGTMKEAWAWIDERLKEFAADKGRPRSVCFKLGGTEFRGLRFPDRNPGRDLNALEP